MFRIDYVVVLIVNIFLFLFCLVENIAMLIIGGWFYFDRIEQQLKLQKRGLYLSAFIDLGHVITAINAMNNNRYYQCNERRLRADTRLHKNIRNLTHPERPR
jgi:hypothetical protein